MQKKEVFQNLSVEEQMLLIMESASTLLVRKEGNLSIKLFEFEGFFVEVKYNTLEKKIETVSVVELNVVTDDYLANIHIENLY